MAVVISSALVLNESTLSYPLSHTRIGYRDFVKDATVSGTSAATGTALSMVQTDFTYERYQPITVPANVAFDLGSVESVNYVGIAAHTIGSTGNAVEVQTSPDGVGSWSTVIDSNPANNDALMLLFETKNKRYWRIRVSGGTTPQIGVVYIGLTLDMMRPIYVGHRPITLNRTVTKRGARSDSGQFLGNTVVRLGQSTSFNWTNIKPDWYRNNFDAFAKHAESLPFFIAWRPVKYPNEVGFVESTNPVQPENTGRPNLMSVSMSVRGFAQ